MINLHISDELKRRLFLSNEQAVLWTKCLLLVWKFLGWFLAWYRFSCLNTIMKMWSYAENTMCIVNIITSNITVWPQYAVQIESPFSCFTIVTINHQHELIHALSVGTKIGDLEWLKVKIQLCYIYITDRQTSAFGNSCTVALQWSGWLSKLAT